MTAAALNSQPSTLNPPVELPPGVRYDGPWPFPEAGKTLHLFTDLAETKSSIGIYEADLTEAKLASEIERTRAKFRQAAAFLSAPSVPSVVPLPAEAELFYDEGEGAWYAEITDPEAGLIERTPLRKVPTLSEGKATRLKVIADAHAAIARLQRERGSQLSTLNSQL